MSVRVLIVDDEPLACERLAAMLGGIDGVTIDGVVEDGTEAIDRIVRAAPDVVLLDVEMPLLDGFDVIEQLSRRGSPVPFIVFVTAHGCHAPSAFDSGVVDFLTKPVRLSRLELAIERVREAIEKRDAVERLHQAAEPAGAPHDGVGGRKADDFWVQRRGESVRIDLERVDRFAAEGEYIRIFVGEANYLHRGSLTSMLDRLDPQLFVRVHRSLIINREKIRSVRRSRTGSYWLVTNDGNELAVGRSYRQRVREIVRSSAGP